MALIAYYTLPFLTSRISCMRRCSSIDVNNATTLATMNRKTDHAAIGNDSAIHGLFVNVNQIAEPIDPTNKSKASIANTLATSSTNLKLTDLIFEKGFM